MYVLNYQINTIISDEAVVISDFAAAFQLPYKSVSTSQEFFNKTSVMDLVFVIITRSSDGTITRKYIDYMAAQEEHDTLYVCQAFHHLLGISNTLVGIRHINLWSDGGPHHFKIYRTLFLLWQLQGEYNIEISYNFFVSGHGKSLCDSHIGNAKQHVRQTSLTTDIETVDQLISVVINLKNTYAYNLGKIDRTLKYQCLEFDNEIKEYHEFKFERKKPICYHRELSGIGEWTQSYFVEVSDVCKTDNNCQFILDSLSQMVSDSQYEVEEITFEDNEYQRLEKDYSTKIYDQDSNGDEGEQQYRAMEQNLYDWMINNKYLDKDKKLTSAVIKEFLKTKKEEGYQCVQITNWYQLKSVYICCMYSNLSKFERNDKT